MKYCPTCSTRYDEEILRFCMKDGTPLVEEEEPAFIQMPSESIEKIDEDEAGEVTVIRKNAAVPPPPPPPQNLIDDISFSPDPVPSRDRIVVPTADEQPIAQARARVIPPYQPLPQPPNTGKVVALTILGTLAAMALGAFGFWMLQDGDTAANININTNFNNSLENLNVNTNTGLDSNFNFNTNANFNSNFNTNINANYASNLRTPTPTPRPSPSPTATAAPSPTPDSSNTPVPTPTRAPVSTPTPIVIRPTPPRMAPLPANRPAGNNGLEGR